MKNKKASIHRIRQIAKAEVQGRLGTRRGSVSTYLWLVWMVSCVWSVWSVSVVSNVWYGITTTDPLEVAAQMDVNRNEDENGFSKMQDPIIRLRLEDSENRLEGGKIN
jgi:hypothetical protein